MTIKNRFPDVAPVLNLDFANTKRLDPRITFTRASTGTYVDEFGIIKTAAANQARFDHDSAGNSLGLLIEEARTNYATYSENLTSSAFTASGASLYPNSTLSLNGLFNAYKIAENTANSSHYIGVSFGSGSGLTYVFSFFIKASGRTSIYVEPQPGNFTGSGGWIFDLSAGTYSGFRSGQQQVAISSVGGGWYKCICSSMASINGTNSFRIYLYSGSSTYTGDGSSGVQICCPQIEIGNFATSYIPTPATFTSRASTATYYDANGVIQTAGSGVARSNAYFPDSNGVMRPAGLLLEAAGTNLETQSTSLSTWTASNSSLTGQTITAPDGTSSTVQLLKEDASTGTHSISRFYNNTYTDWRISFYVKAAGRTKFRTTTIDGIVTTRFDLSAKTVNGASSPDLLEQLPNGWFRVKSIGGSAYRVGSPAIILEDNSGNQSYAGDNTSGIYIWGVQLEQASGVTYSTSYIPTAGSTVTRSADVSSSSTVTRSADVASMTGTNFSSWWSSGPSTYYASVISRASNQNNRAILGITGSSTERQVTLSFDVNSATIGTRINNIFYGSSVSMSPLGIPVKAAGAITSSEVRLSVNGTLGNAGSPPRLATSVPTQMDVGRFLADSQYSLNGTISRITYYDRRLTDAQLQALTL